MGERERGAPHPQGGCDVSGAPVKEQRRSSAGFAHHFDFKPINAPADARAESLCPGLFGGKTRRQAFGGTLLAEAVSLFRRSKDAIEEPLPEAFDRLLDTANFDQVDPTANDHVVYQNTQPAPGPRSDSCERKRAGAQGSCVKQGQGAFQSRTSVKSQRMITDKSTVREVIPIADHSKELPAAPWAMRMRAISLVEPSRLVQTLTGAILGCGGWILSRAANDTGGVNLLFEFERQVCVDIYTVLIASGLELSQSGHLRLTELCQCTRLHSNECGGQIASIDLEIQTYPLEMANSGQPSGME